jgi:hypothetical protein
MNPTDAHVIRNILIQMLINTRTPEPMDDLIPAQVQGLKTLFKDLATYLNDSYLGSTRFTPAASDQPAGRARSPDLNTVSSRVYAKWPNTSLEIVPDVQGTWESCCENRAATHGCKLSMGTVLNVAKRDVRGTSRYRQK